MIEKMAPGEWFVFGFVSILFFGGLTIYIRYQIKRFKRLKEKKAKK
ncbi:MAG: hypothetical protein HOK72_06100 [Flavobacteriales bacterium]|jgi:hypothetical protein|nr:hypothetical protein [Flavobacteriales bacterium]